MTLPPADLSALTCFQKHSVARVFLAPAKIKPGPSAFFKTSQNIPDPTEELLCSLPENIFLVITLKKEIYRACLSEQQKAIENGFAK